MTICCRRVFKRYAKRKIRNTVLKVCLFGKYDPQYHRYRVLRKGLQRCGIPFVECQTGKFFDSSFKVSLFVLENLELLRKLVESKRDFSHIIVCTDRFHVPLAYLYARIYHKKLIFDPVTSWYATEVHEQCLVRKLSIKAKLLLMYERVVFKLPDCILATTEEFKRFYSKLFSLSLDRISVLPVGGELTTGACSDNPSKGDTFRVTYWGKFLPQHGLECVLQAAKILQENTDVIFVMVGSGFAWERIRRLSTEMNLSNVIFTGYLPGTKFAEEISRADVVLGFFRKGGRASRSIGNKIFEGFSLRKPVITGSYPAIRRYFSHKKTLYMVEPGNPKDLAKGIRELKNNPGIRAQIAQNGYDCLREDFSEQKIGERLKDILDEV